MGYAYGTPGVVGHVVVVKGYITVAGTNYVVLNDPWAPCEGTERLLESTPPTQILPARPLTGVPGTDIAKK